MTESIPFYSVDRSPLLKYGELTPKRAKEILLGGQRYRSREYTLEILFSILTYEGHFPGMPKNETHRWPVPEGSLFDLKTRFFNERRLILILRGVKAGKADDKVKAALQKHLNLTGWCGCHTPLWIFFTAWLKRRILNCFDIYDLQARFRCPFDRIITDHKVPLYELITLPIGEEKRIRGHSEVRLLPPIGPVQDIGCTAKEAIELINAYPGDSSSDPPLNRIIALLLYRFEGQPNPVYNATPGSSRIDEDFRNYSGFFIQNRVRAIINAVLRGEAPGKVLDALQAELNRTARGHSVMYLGMYCQSFARQVLWLKGRILECFDSDPVELYWEKTSKSSYPFLMEGFDLNTLLKTPLREPYAHEIPKTSLIG